MPALTSTTAVPPAVTTFFSRDLLRRALPKLVHMRVAQRRPLKMRNGDTIKFRRYAALTVSTTPLTEGVTPTGSVMSYTDVTSTLKQHGDFITLTDLVQAVVDSPVLLEANRLLAEQSSQTVDQLMRDVAVAGTAVVYGGGVAARTSLANTAHKIDTAVLDRAIRTLNNANASHYTDMISATVKVSTHPIRPCYWGIMHPDVLFTAENLPGWKDVSEYASTEPVMEAEVGSYKNIRFLCTTHAKLFPNAGGAISGADVKSTGGTLADVYATLIFGTDAVGAVPLDGMSLENIIHPLGEAGSSDPLNQQATSGWKLTATRLILNDAFMVRVETTAGSVNP